MKLTIGILLVGAILLVILDFSLGSVYISWKEILSYLSGSFSSSDGVYVILHHIRLPRVIAAIASGLSLSLAGLLMQTYFRNPLAGPYVLGISSGAALGVALFIMASSILGLYLPNSILLLGISGFAFIGTLVFMIIIYLASLRFQQSTTLLIAGILLGSFAHAVITFLQNIADTMQLQSFVYWNMGNLSHANLISCLISLSTGLVAFVILLYHSNYLDLWLIGEEQSQSNGLPKKYFTWFVFLLTSILAGLTTAYFGPIAFIGLISPHIAKMIFKTQVHAKLIIYTAFVGSYMMLISDILLQLLYVSHLPLNTITSLLSLPLLTYIFLSKKELWT